MPVIVSLPFPPSMNGYYAVVRGRKVLSKRGRQFKQDVGWHAHDQLASKVDGRLSVTIKLFPPTKAKRDIDNYVKPTLDACQDAGLFENDNQIDRLLVVRGDVCKGGKCIVTITQISDGSD